MQIGGYRLRQHLKMLAPMFMLLAAVWGLRWVLGGMGAPGWLLQVASITAATPVAVLLAVLVIHFRRFGGYANVVVSSLLLNLCAELLIVAAIAFSVLTDIPNVYTTPEFSISRPDPQHLLHMRGHLTFGIGIGTLAGAAMGCLLLFLLRRLVPAKPSAGDSASGRWRP
jgi:ABC-type uncharacterized transport system permease subunit